MRRLTYPHWYFLAFAGDRPAIDDAIQGPCQLRWLPLLLLQNRLLLHPLLPGPRPLRLRLPHPPRLRPSHPHHRPCWTSWTSRPLGLLRPFVC